MPTILKCKNKPQYVTTYTELWKEQQHCIVYTILYNNEVIEHRESYLSVYDERTEHEVGAETYIICSF